LFAHGLWRKREKEKSERGMKGEKRSKRQVKFESKTWKIRYETLSFFLLVA